MNYSEHISLFAVAKNHTFSHKSKRKDQEKNQFEGMKKILQFE